MLNSEAEVSDETLFVSELPLDDVVAFISIEFGIKDDASLWVKIENMSHKFLRFKTKYVWLSSNNVVPFMPIEFVIKDDVNLWVKIENEVANSALQY